MNPAVAFQPLSSVAAEFFPPEDLKVVEVPFFDEASLRGKTFLAAVAAVKPNTCLELQPGTYPAVTIRRNVFIRAAIPGTVEIIAKKGQPALIADAPCVRLQGLSLQPAPGDDKAVAVRSGCLILKGCELTGTVTAGDTATRLYLAKCRILSPGIGVQVSADSTAVIETSAFLGCATGVIAGEGSRAVIHHSRFHGCTGAAVRALKAVVECVGCRFVDNQKGVELDHCTGATLSTCLFDSNALGSVLALGGEPPQLHAVQFWGRPPGGPEHLQLSEVEAVIRFCTFNDVSLHVGIAPETEIIPASAGSLERHLRQLKKIAVSQEIKSGLESILRNAQSALQRIERGLPIPLQLFHCVFEGEPHLGQYRVGTLLANSLKELGFLSTNKLVEVEMDDVLLHKRSIGEIAREAKGGALLIQVSRFRNKREAHAFYSKTREILEALIAASGNSSIIILCGEREAIRPILKKSALAEALGQQVVRFAPYAPGELLQVFATLCEDHQIPLTPRAIEKLLLTFYMLDDRRDKRFIRTGAIRSLFETSEKQHRKRCADENDYKLPMDEADLNLPLEQNVDLVLSCQPALVTVCPKCNAQLPWLPGTSTAVSHCPDCGHAWEPGWGIWKESSFFRRILQKEESDDGLEDIRPIIPRFKS